MLHRSINLKSIPERIISLVPSQTELIVDLGLEEKLVGVTKFCVHPVHIRKAATIVGGTKQVNYLKIKQLQPDIILCNKEENTKEMVQKLETIAPVWVSDVYTIEDTLEMISLIGGLFNVAENSRNLIAAIKAKWDDFKTAVKNTSTKKVAYLIWKNPYMAVGENTFINSLLKQNNFKNIYDDGLGRYPEIDINVMPEVDLVLLATEPYPFRQKDVIELKKTLQKEVRLVDGEFFSWYGSRLKDAFAYFKSLH